MFNWKKGGQLQPEVERSLVIMFGCRIPKIQTRFLSNFLSTQNFCSLRSWVTVDLPVNSISSNTTLHLTLSHMPTALLNNWLSLRHREQPQPHRPKKRPRSSILNVEFLTREPVLHIGLEEIQARADPKNVPGPEPWMLCSWPNDRSCFLDIEKSSSGQTGNLYPVLFGKRWMFLSMTRFFIDFEKVKGK